MTEAQTEQLQTDLHPMPGWIAVTKFDPSESKASDLTIASPVGGGLRLRGHVPSTSGRRLVGCLEAYVVECGPLPEGFEHIPQLSPGALVLYLGDHGIEADNLIFLKMQSIIATDQDVVSAAEH